MSGQLVRTSFVGERKETSLLVDQVLVSRRHSNPSGSRHQQDSHRATNHIEDDAPFKTKF